jgi:hypothetical protein
MCHGARVTKLIDPILDGLLTQLRAFNGHRTVWIDESTGAIVHTEPEVELEALGYRYVDTVFAPRRDELAALLAACPRPAVAEQRSVTMPLQLSAIPA